MTWRPPGDTDPPQTLTRSDVDGPSCPFVMSAPPWEGLGAGAGPLPEGWDGAGGLPDVFLVRGRITLFCSQRPCGDARGLKATLKGLWRVSQGDC
jgi:hypothetical protein